jgi:hypothetical protein
MVLRLRVNCLDRALAGPRRRKLSSGDALETTRAPELTRGSSFMSAARSP